MSNLLDTGTRSKTITINTGAERISALTERSTIMYVLHKGSLRPLSELAFIIEENWQNPSPPAVSHIEALGAMTSTRSTLWGVTGLDAIRSFLLTSRKWSGDVAREVRAELRAHVAAHTEEAAR
jgi:hypothetical protein